MSKVFFTKDINAVDGLFDAAGLKDIIHTDDYTALKIHFGERGNNAYLRSERTKALVKKVRACGAKPFWTDTNTLYNGSRSNTLLHLQTAFDHGYTFGKTGAPVVIADGLNGKASTSLPVDLKHFKEIYVAPLLSEIDSLIAVTHFKGHEVTGFGGALKNIGMGLASRRGKLEMHSDCGNCKASLACKKKQDLASCWVGSSLLVQEKLMEYCAGILNKFKNKCGFINFITDVSPNCDCYDHNDEPIVPDIGILASLDPVALDQASADMVNNTEGRIKGQDKFKTIWPQVDWEIQLAYAEKLALGSRTYTLREDR